MKDIVCKKPTKEKSKKWNDYKKNLLLREQAKKNHLIAKFHWYNALAIKMAEWLYQHYHVKSVYLIGSLLDIDLFHQGSDIDIAVEGIKAKDYLSAWIDLEKIAQEHSFHLIDINEISAEFKEKIHKQGKIL